MTNGREPFDVEPRWSPERKEAFALYRDFGASRSLRATAEKLGKSEGMIEQWSREDGWVARVAMYDAHLDRIQQSKVIEERSRVAKMHADALDSTITVLMQAPLALAEKITKGDLKIDVEESDPYLLTRATEAAAKVLPALINASRLVHGFSTQNVEVQDSRIANAAPEELDRLLGGLDDGTQTLEGLSKPSELPNGTE